MRAAPGANIPVTVSSAVTPGGASAAYVFLILITLAIATMGALALRKMGGTLPSASFSLPWGAKKQAPQTGAAAAASAPTSVRNPINGDSAAGHVESWGAAS